MPLNKTGKKIKGKMAKRYGKKKGESVFYATMNKRDMMGMMDEMGMKDESPLGRHSRKKK